MPVGPQLDGRASAAAIANAGSIGTMPPLVVGGSPTLVWTRGLVFAALYFVTMVGCIALTRYGAQVAPIWIPSALLAWTLIGAATKDWLLLTALTTVAHVAGAIVVGDQFEIEVVYLVANLASPLLVAGLLRRWDDSLEFTDRSEVWRFLLLAGLLAPAVSAGIVAATAAFNGHFDTRTTTIWYLSDALSFVVFLPLFRIVASNGWRQLFAPGLLQRTLILFGILLAAHVIAALLPAAGYRIFMILLIPYLIYIAFDVGLTGARAAVALSAVLVLACALFIPAPPDRGMDPQQFLLAMQAYVAATVACVLPIAAALEERQRLYETAAEALQEAQQAWGEIIAAEALYRLVADNTEELMLRLNREGEILFASPACVVLNASPDDMVGTYLRDITHPDDAATARTELLALGDAAVDAARSWRIRLRDANQVWRLFDLRAAVVSSESGEFVAVLRQAPE